MAGAIDAPDVALAGWTTKFRFAGVPGLTTTVAVCVIATPFTVADTVFDSATVDVRVVVVTPLLLVAAGCANVFPVPDTAITTVAPATGLPAPSFAVTVMVDPAPPAVIGEVAPTVV